MEFSDYDVIRLVEQNECLYNRKHLHFKDINKKRAIWESIGQQVGISGEFCARRFANLRDKFTRELKLQTTTAESDAPYISKWLYFEQMQFLRRYMMKRKQRNYAQEAKIFDQADLNEYKLIKLVEQNGCLYNRKHRDFKDAKKKKAIWDAIGRKLGISGEFCLRRFSNLRDKLSRELKLEKAEGENGLLYNSSWPFFEQMQFLRPFMMQRKKRDNFNFSNFADFKSEDLSLGLTISSIFESDGENVDEKMTYTLPSPPATSSRHASIRSRSSSITSQDNKKKIKLVEFEEVNSDFQNIAPGYDKVCDCMSVKDDVVRGFCTMMRGSLLTMDHKKKIHTIKKLTDVLYDAENEEYD